MSQTLLQSLAPPAAFDEPPEAADATEAADAPPPQAAAAGTAPVPATLPTVRLGGVELHQITEERVIETILAELECGRGGVVVTPNLDHLHRAQKNMTFAALVAEADLVVADGMPLVWASRLKGTPLPERVAGSNLISSLSRAASQAGRRVFLLGGDPGTAEGAARVLRGRHADLNVVGTHCPPKGFEYDSAQMALIVDKLVAARPDIVFVALGSPKQEQLINTVRRSLPGAWWLGVGISFSFLTGQVRRAPGWMQRNGLEWLHRLYQEPRRLIKRYLVVGLPFASRLAARAVYERAAARLGLAAAEPVKRLATGAATGTARDQSLPQADVADSAASADVGGDVGGDVDEITAAAADESAAAAGASPADADGRGGDAPASLGRLRALVLLGGKVRPSAFTRGCGRPTLELPVADGERLLDHWLRQAEGVARLAGIDRLPVRVVVSDAHDEPEPQTPAGVAPRAAGAFAVERDLSEFRGTGGVLHDLAGGYDDDDWLLVCNAGQILTDPLPVIARALAHKGADVALVAHDDGTPGGVTLLRVATLRRISDIGYVDFKEQALPQIARHFAVKAVRCRRATATSVRSTEAYLGALQRHHAKLAGRGRGAEPDPLEDSFTKSFALVEPGAEVDASAYLHDAVVLRGARIEPGATVVRSVVCEGAVVRRNERVVDALVTRPAGEFATPRGLFAARRSA